MFATDRKAVPIDFLAGIAVSALGHDHPRLVRDLRDQLGRLIHVSNLWAHPIQLEVAAGTRRPAGSRGSSSRTAAPSDRACLKMARKHRPNRPGFVALEGGFHAHLGALSITHHEQYPRSFEPLVPGVTSCRGKTRAPSRPRSPRRPPR